MEQFSKIFEKFVVEKSFLYLVSTPIGNLGDLSLRSIKTLQEVDYILCEDTRVTNKILSKLEIKNKNLISYNDFNSKNRCPVICGHDPSGGLEDVMNLPMGDSAWPGRGQVSVFA